MTMATKRMKKKKNTPQKRNSYITRLRELAQEDHPEALYQLGMEYLSGEHLSYNANRAFSYLEKSANHYYVPAMLELAFSYMTARGVKRDFEQARHWAKRALSLGSHEASDLLRQIDYAQVQEASNEKEYQQALKGYQNGDLKETSHLGECYIYGIGVTCDKEKGLALLHEALDQGYKEDAMLIGDTYFFDEELKNDAKALKYYQYGNQDNNKESLYMTGSIYINTYQDYNQGIAYLKKAAQYESAQAAYQLAIFYLGDNPHVPQDTKALKYYLHQALKADYEDAFEFLDYLHNEQSLKGRKVLSLDDFIELSQIAAKTKRPEDLNRLAFDYFKAQQTDLALKYLKEAANLGHEQSLRLLQVLSINKDDPENSLISAASKGDQSDAMNLASFYFSGIIVEKNIEKALEWLHIAYEKGSYEAGSILGEFYLTGEHVTQDTKKAISLLEDCAKHNNMRSLMILVDCYEKGIGVTKNKKKAELLKNKIANLENR